RHHRLRSYSLYAVRIDVRFQVPADSEQARMAGDARGSPVRVGHRRQDWLRIELSLPLDRSDHLRPAHAVGHWRDIQYLPPQLHRREARSGQWQHELLPRAFSRRLARVQAWWQLVDGRLAA